MRNACRPMGRFFCLLAVAAMLPVSLVHAQTNGPAMTQVVDTVYRADGTAARGMVLISWPAFTTADGKAVAAGSLNVQLGNGGAFTASLAPNTGAQPAGVYYKVIFQLAGQEPSTEYWVVPATNSTSIGAVRAKLMPPTIAAQVLTRDVADTNYVHVSDDQTVSGVKTFSNSPSVPTPQNAGDAANKGYVDSTAANVNLASPAPIGSVTPNSGAFTALYIKNGQPWYDAIANGAFGDCNRAGAGGAGTCAHDDTEAIQSIINAACGPSGSGVAYIPQGVYNITSSLTVPAYTNPILGSRSCKIVGSCADNAYPSIDQSGYGYAQQAWACTTLANYTAGDTLLIDSTANESGNVEISGIRFWGNTQTGNHIHMTARSSHGIHNVSIHGNSFVGKLSAVTADTDSNSRFWWVKIEDNWMTAQFGNPVQLRSALGTGPLTIRHNWIVFFGNMGTQCEGTYNACGIDLYNLNNVEVSGNEVSNQARANEAGIVCRSCYATKLDSNDIEAMDVATDLNGYSLSLTNTTTWCIANGAILNAVNRATIGQNRWLSGAGCPSPLSSAGNYAVQLLNTSDVTVTTAQESTFADDVYDQPASGSTDVLIGHNGSVRAGNATVQNLTVNGTCTGCGTGTVNLASPPAIGTTTPNAGAFTTLAATDLKSKTWPVVDLRANGLVGDLVTLSNCGMTAAANTLTCVGSNFAAADVGKSISVAGAGSVAGSNYILNATISGYTSTTVVTISTSATHTVSGQQAWYGTDNYAAMCAVTNCSNAALPNRYINGASTGQRLVLPYGSYYTSHPFYIRNGQYLQGASEIAAAVLLFDSAANAPTICANGNASGGTDSCVGDATGTLDVGVSDVYVGTPITGTQPGVEITNASGWFADRIWTQSAVGILVNASNLGSIRDMTCDAGTGQCIELLGAGQTAGADYQSTTHSIVIDGLKAYAPTYSCVWVDGADGVEISNMQCDYAKQYGVYLYSPEGMSSHRLHIQNSHLTSSLVSGYYTQSQNCFAITGNATDVLFEGNTCAHWQSDDIAINDPYAARNIVIKGNVFKDSGAAGGAGGNSATSIVAGSHVTGLTIEGNTFDHAGGVAVYSGSPTYAVNNRCFSPFSTVAAAGPDYNNGCLNFVGASAAGSIAMNNTTDSALYPAVSYSGGADSTTNSNHSGYSFDVATNSSNAGCCTTGNERTENAATIGVGAFRDPGLPGNGFLVSKYPSIQAAIDAAYNNGTVRGAGLVIDDRTAPYSGPGFIVRDSVTLKLAATTYTITGTVSNNNGVANVTAGVISMPGSHIVGAGTSPNHGTNVNAGAGLNADLIATSTVGTGTGANAQWWHWASIENFHIDGNKANETAGNCINVENMGETAVLRSLELGNCFNDDIKLEGKFRDPVGDFERHDEQRGAVRRGPG